MQSLNENHIIYPTYQQILNLCIYTVITRMNEGDTFGAWRAVRNLYRWLPSECKKEVEPTFRNTVQKLNNINRQANHIDFNVRTSERHKLQSDCLFEENEILCDAISLSLRKHNWLDRDATVKPRFGNIPEMKVGP